MPPSKSKGPEFYIATDSGSCEIDGETYVFSRDTTRIRAGHPILAAVPHCFEPVADHIHYEDAPADSKRGETRAEVTPEPEPEPEPEKPADIPSGLSHAGLRHSFGKGGE